MTKTIFEKTNASALDAVSAILEGSRLNKNQKKLDVNHNGELDSDDFKKLRASQTKTGKTPLAEDFNSLERKLAAQGAENPAGLAAHIGRKKFGKKRFQKMAEAGKKKAEVNESYGEDAIATPTFSGSHPHLKSLVIGKRDVKRAAKNIAASFPESELHSAADSHTIKLKSGEEFGIKKVIKKGWKGPRSMWQVHSNHEAHTHANEETHEHSADGKKMTTVTTWKKVRPSSAVEHISIPSAIDSLHQHANDIKDMASYKNEINESRADPKPKGYEHSRSSSSKKPVYGFSVEFNSKMPNKKFDALHTSLKPHDGGGVNDDMSWHWTYASKEKALEHAKRVKDGMGSIPHKLSHYTTLDEDFNDPDEKQKRSTRFRNNVVGGAITGASVGTAIGTPGVGTAVGAGVGAASGALRATAADAGDYAKHVGQKIKSGAKTAVNWAKSASPALSRFKDKVTSNIKNRIAGAKQLATGKTSALAEDYATIIDKAFEEENRYFNLDVDLFRDTLKEAVINTLNEDTEINIAQLIDYTFSEILSNPTTGEAE